MEYINYSDFKLKNSAVCLGKFDGIHMGHRRLIEYSIAQKKAGLHSVVFTFSVHPAFLKKEDFSLIYNEEEKKEILEEMGVDTLVSYPFDEAMFSMEPKEFIKKVLVEKLDTKIIIVGTDFHFGHNRKGDTKLLEEYAGKYGYKLKVFEKICMDGSDVSSTRIRACIGEGRMEEANRLLGAPYRIRGMVVYGKQLGRKLGMPTANLKPDSVKLLPPNGVYASRIFFDGGYWDGISNIGVKPTVAETQHILQPSLETYLFDYSGNLYGRKVTVFLYNHTRPECRFSSVEELKDRMEQDVLLGKQYFSQ